MKNNHQVAKFSAPSSSAHIFPKTELPQNNNPSVLQLLPSAYYLLPNMMSCWILFCLHKMLIAGCYAKTENILTVFCCCCCYNAKMKHLSDFNASPSTRYYSLWDPLDVLIRLVSQFMTSVSNLVYNSSQNFVNAINPQQQVFFLFLWSESFLHYWISKTNTYLPQFY